MKKEIKPWTRVGREKLASTRIFDVFADRMRSPDGSHEDDFYFLETSDWVNVIPLTAEKELVLVRQFRHGVKQAHLEVPGGIIEEKHNAEPERAAAEELKEETGYRAARIIPVGKNFPNPAIQSNRCFFFLAEDVTRVGEQELDDAEDISVEIFPFADVPELVASGEICHSLTMCALFFTMLHYDKF